MISGVGFQIRRPVAAETVNNRFGHGRLRQSRRTDVNVFSQCGEGVPGTKTQSGKPAFRMILPGWFRALRLLGVGLGCLSFVACNLVPSTPDGLFVLYRDRMKSGNLDQARALLSDTSRRLVLALTEDYKLKEPPESMALLNALDPANPPTVLKTTDTLALLNVRTLKGGTRLVRLTRRNADAPWKIDISEELSSFRSFLQTQQALDMMREQAGEYAASWKAFNDRLQSMHVVQQPSPVHEPSKARPMKPPPKKQVHKNKHAVRTEKNKK
jgi:hypothetical protein